MSDLFGLLPLPAPVPDEGAALTDPALDIMLDFIRAVLNAELGNAWRAVVPTDPIPVAYVFNHAPSAESFNMDEVPALYGWRPDDSDTAHRYSQDLVADTAGMQFLWVPPALPQEQERYVHAVVNGIKKSLKLALAQGRHPAWVLAGDTYYDPEEYGSVLFRYAKLASARLGAVKQQPLNIESADRSFRKTYDSILFGVTALEFSSKDLSVEAPLRSANGTIYLARPGARENALPVLSFTLDPALTTLSVTSGPLAGGTSTTISGAELSDAGPDGTSLRVFFDDAEVDADLLELVDESTLSVVSPPGATTGPANIRVVFPSGVEKTLIDAFTYT